MVWICFTFSLSPFFENPVLDRYVSTDNYLFDASFIKLVILSTEVKWSRDGDWEDGLDMLHFLTFTFL